MLELGTKVLLSYLLGSISGSLLLGRLKGGIDIRTQGSGNAGSTNAFRTQGKGFALGVVAIDIGKGYLAAWLIPGLFFLGLEPDPLVDRQWLLVSCGAAAVIGHCYPVWHEFRGGKGAATLVGVLAFVQPILLIPVFLIWIATVIFSGYVGLATMLAAAAAPVWLLATGRAGDTPLIVFTTAMALFLIVTHRQNLRRMIDGSENQHASLMLFRRRSS